jgi:hypothetical protein
LTRPLGPNIAVLAGQSPQEKRPSETVNPSYEPG